MLKHLVPGSVVYHDKERSHTGLLKAAKCESKTFKADITDPVYLESMAMINDFCAWLKRYLHRFPGMSKENLQSYLNWYVYLFRIKQSDEKWPKVGRVVRHLLCNEKEFSTSK